MWILLVLALPLVAQQKELEAARSAIASAKYCFLITVDETGQPQARLMEPFDPDADMKVWLGTNPVTRKVGQLRKNPRATLAYYDAKGPNYVTLIGSARIVDDIAERRKHWRKDFTMHFPGGPEGKNYTLVEFTPSRIELVSTSKGVGDKAASPLPAILDRSSAGWRVRN